MGTTVTPCASTVRNVRFNSGIWSCCDTSAVNQPTCAPYCTLSSIIRVKNASSPPSHHSSLLCPPKLRFTEASSPFKLRHLRLDWASASCCDLKNGGLHRVNSK